jgi:hypothetical protein
MSAGSFPVSFHPIRGAFGGTAADTSTLVETVVLPDGSQIERICETTMQGARIGKERK